MKKKSLANLMMAASAILPMMSSKKHGSKSGCPFCTIDKNMEHQEMRELMLACDYHFDGDVSMEEVLSPQFSQLNPSGSANTLVKAKTKLEEAVSSLTKAEYQDFDRLFTKFPEKYPGLTGTLFELIIKLRPYEVKLLHNMGFCNTASNYFFTKSMIKMCQAIGIRNFINRYLQRTAVVVPNEIVVQPIFQRKVSWLNDWVCTHRNRNIETTISKMEKKINRMGLDFNRDRVFYVYDKSKDKYTNVTLDLLSSLQKLAEVAWFLKVAELSGVTRGSDLLYTYPVENVFTEKRFSNEIGDTVFSKVEYRLHVPAGECPDTDKYFEEIGINHDEDVVRDDKIAQPYLYFYQKGSPKPSSIVYYSFTSGSGSIVRTPIFTYTEKMNAPSFSIPAGMPQYGGSCISSSYEATGPNKNNTICRGCYALKGNYLYVGYVYAAAPRMNWLVESLQSDQFGGKLAYLLSTAIESYARYGRSSSRKELEFGFIKGESLVYPSGKNKTTIFAPIQMRVGGDSQQWIDFTQQGKVAGYFRIHDSGDFTISSNQTTNIKYINTWALIAGVFDQVIFWAPTRNWTTGYGDLENTIEINDKTLQAAFADMEKGIGKQVFDRLGLRSVVTEAKSLWTVYVNAMNNACELNPNLIIRPSGLTVITPFNRDFIKIPMLQSLLGFSERLFLSAGTGVNATFGQATNPRFTFTNKAFDTIAFEEAYPPGEQGRLQVKTKIGDYLKQYFLRRYKGRLPKVSYTQAKSMDGSKVWQCPVNLKTNEEGQSITSADSCLGSNCRYCWIKPDGPVTYGAH